MARVARARVARAMRARNVDFGRIGSQRVRFTQHLFGKPSQREKGRTMFAPLVSKLKHCRPMGVLATITSSKALNGMMRRRMASPFLWLSSGNMRIGREGIRSIGRLGSRVVDRVAAKLLGGRDKAEADAPKYCFCASSHPNCQMYATSIVC